MFVKILNFPYVIQREIIKQMDYSQLILFSLCSLKSLKLIQSIKSREVIELKFLYLNFCSFFDVVHKDGNSSGILTLIHNSSFDNIAKEEIKELTLLGRKFQFGFTGEESTLCFYKDTPNEAIIEVIHDYFCVLFGPKLETSLISLENRDDKVFIPKLKNTKSAMLRSFGLLDSQRLKELFSVSPNLGVVEMFTPLFELTIKRDLFL